MISGVIADAGTNCIAAAMVKAECTEGILP